MAAISVGNMIVDVVRYTDENGETWLRIKEDNLISLLVEAAELGAEASPQKVE